MMTPWFDQVEMRWFYSPAAAPAGSPTHAPPRLAAQQRRRRLVGKFDALVAPDADVVARQLDALRRLAAGEHDATHDKIKCNDRYNRHNKLHEQQIEERKVAPES